jgi:ribose transport system permease protein
MNDSSAVRPASSPKGAQLNLLRYLRQLGFALISIIVLVVIFSLLNGRFFSYANWYHIAQQVSMIALLAVGQTFVVATAGIDISQGSVLALTAMTCAILIVTFHWPVLLAILAALLVGAAAGWLVGFSIVRLNVPPFIATLGMLAIALGLALLSTDGTPIFGLPQSFLNISEGRFLGIPHMAWIALVVAVIAAFVLNKTRFGRYTLAIGSNAESARRVGINVSAHLLWIYSLAGVVSALTGVVYVAYTSAAQPTAGNNYELYSIAAVVIGGGSLFGGVGTILGSFLGALLMTVLKNGTQLAGISPYVEEVILGVVVIGAVYIDNLRRRLR